jgi:hypothetical protein
MGSTDTAAGDEDGRSARRPDDGENRESQFASW